MATPTLTPPNSKEEQDDRYAPSSFVDDVKRQEEEGVDDKFADIKDHYGETADPSQEDANIEAFKYSQTGGGEKTTRAKVTGFLKKAGPAGGLGMLLFGGAGLGLFFLSPGLLLVQMKEVFTNYGSSASRASVPRYNKMLAYTIGNDKVDKACNKKPTGTKCRLGTMSKAQKDAYEKAGFKINGNDFNGRTRVKSVVFPDGHPSTTGKDFERHTKRSVAAASAASKAHNPATKVFNGARFTTNVLKNKFNQTKANEKINGDTDEERKENFNKRTGENISDEERASKFSSKYKDGLKATSTKLSRLSGAAGIACGGYNVSKGFITAVKIANGVRFASYALVFLKVADQIKNKGDVDPATVALLGGVLTSTAATGVKAGLAATDSSGYKTAAYGGEGALKEFAQAFLLGGNPKLISLDKTIKYIENDIAGGRSNIRGLCRKATDPKWAITLALAMCGAQVASGAIGGTIIPILGNAAGAAAAVAACVVEMLISAVALSTAINFMVDKALDYAVKVLAGTTLDVNKITGVDAGNAMGIGAAVMLGATALSRGLKAGNKSEVTQFLAATAEDQAQADRIAVYDAKSEPFNIYNQYSFLGSTLRKTGIALRAPVSISEGVSNLGTMVRSSLTFGAVASASPASMPVNITSADLSACPDPDMTDIGIDCDRMGNPQYVLSPEELAMEVGDNIGFMEDHDEDTTTGFVDDDGNPLDNGKGKLYKKWLSNCTEQRESPMGATMMAIEEDDYDWGTGENCVSSEGDGAATEEALSNFRVFYNINAEKEDGDYVPPVGSSEATGEAGSLTVATYNITRTGENGGTLEKTGRAADLMKEKSASIIGVQEIDGGAQYQTFLSHLGGNYAGKVNPDDGGGRAIFWDKTLFSLGKSGFYNTQKDGEQKQMVWVELKASSGKSVYVFDMHANKGNSSPPWDSIRAGNAQDTLDAMESVVGSSGSPVIIMGDMNSNYSTPGRRAVFEKFTNSGKLDLTTFKASKKTGEKCDTVGDNGRQQCRRSGMGSHLDQIWISNSSGITVNSWENIADDNTITISDHNPVLANLTVPGISSEEDSTNIPQPSKDGWVWPVPAVKDLGILAWGASGSKGIHKGIDIGNRTNALGSPVVAAHDGTITKSYGKGNSCGYYVIVKATGTPYWMGYQHLDDTSAATATVGKAVKAGDVIGKVGRQGGSTCGSAGFFHLHFSVETKNTISEYADPGNNGTINPLSVLPR